MAYRLTTFAGSRCRFARIAARNTMSLTNSAKIAAKKLAQNKNKRIKFMSLEHFHPNFKPAYISGAAEPLDVKGICKERNKNILKSDFAFVSRRMKNPMLHAAIMRMRARR